MPGPKAEGITIDVNALRTKFNTALKFNFKDVKATQALVQEYLDFLLKFMNDNREKLSTDADRRLHRMVKELRADFNRVQQLLGTELAVGVIAEIADEIMSGIRDIADFIEAAPPKSSTNELNKLCGFYDSVQKTLKVRMGELLDTTEMSLPSPAVFMEPVLSNSKGAELYDMRRNSHYELLQAPGIADTDPNVLRARDISLTPTVPPSALSLQGIPDLPLPNTINTALGEAGKLDLSTLVNSNAGTLNSTLATFRPLPLSLPRHPPNSQARPKNRPLQPQVMWPVK